MFNDNAKDNVSSGISSAITSYNNKLITEKQNLTVMQEMLKNLNTSIQDTQFFEGTNKVTDLLRNLKTNIDSTRTNIDNLENVLGSLKTLNENINSSTETRELVLSGENFKKIVSGLKDEAEKNSSNFHALVLQYVKNTSINLGTSSGKHSAINNPVSASETASNTANSESSAFQNVSIPLSENSSETNDEIADNNTLLISEKQRKVFLPYKVKDLNHILNRNKCYRNLQDVINSKYIVPIERYKNATIARFREGYILMKKREKASIADSLDLALEVTFNSSLNPAVITACKNLEELDTYLDYMELNELDRFDIFDIKYEISPFKK